MCHKRREIGTFSRHKVFQIYFQREGTRKEIPRREARKEMRFLARTAGIAPPSLEAVASWGKKARQGTTTLPSRFLAALAEARGAQRRRRAGGGQGRAERPPRGGCLDGRRPATTIEGEGPRDERPGGRCPPAAWAGANQRRAGLPALGAREPGGCSGGLCLLDLGPLESGGLDDELPEAPGLAVLLVGADLKEAGEAHPVALLEEAGLVGPVDAADPARLLHLLGGDGEGEGAELPRLLGEGLLDDLVGNGIVDVAGG